jgi:hypothetical protein
MEDRMENKNPHKMFVEHPELVTQVQIARFLGFTDQQIADSLNALAIGNWIDQAPMPDGLNEPAGDEAGQC